MEYWQKSWTSVHNKNVLFQCNLEIIEAESKYDFRGLKIAFILALLAFTLVDSLHDISRLEGFFAYIFYVLFMFVFSNNRMKVSVFYVFSETSFVRIWKWKLLQNNCFQINWSVVSNALIMHYCIALVILKWSTGQWFFQQVDPIW